MKPNVELAGMARLGLACASGVFLAALAMPAFAGDRALINFIGYSADGRYFAFEEFGVQDGSGFAYSTIYVIDLPADKWVAGTPFHMTAEDFEAEKPLGSVRATLMNRAAGDLNDLDIEVPAEILVLLGDGVPGADGHSLEYSIPNWGPPGSTEEHVFSATLDVFPADSPEDCVTYIGDKAKGYALSFKGEELHRDKTLPKSRGCPLDYRLYAIVQPFEGGAGQKVAIISSYPFGFEGPDRRFLAVPLGN